MTDPSARRKAGLWVALIFLLGAALGGVLGYSYAHRAVSAAASPTESEPVRRARRVEQLTKDLGLSSEQSTQLDSILSNLHSEYKVLHDQHDTEIAQARQRGRNKIREILTPEQKPKFEEFIKKMDEERKKNQPSPPR
jgi:Spy/CpxP family protein refolding chaperone